SVRRPSRCGAPPCARPPACCRPGGAWPASTSRGGGTTTSRRPRPGWRGPPAAGPGRRGGAGTPRGPPAAPPAPPRRPGPRRRGGGARPRLGRGPLVGGGGAGAVAGPRAAPALAQLRAPGAGRPGRRGRHRRGPPPRPEQRQRPAEPSGAPVPARAAAGPGLHLGPAAGLDEGRHWESRLSLHRFPCAKERVMAFHFSRRGLLGALAGAAFGWLAPKAKVEASPPPPPAPPPAPAPVSPAGPYADLSRVTTCVYDCGGLKYSTYLGGAGT